ncbi:MAG: hypothetical protein ACPGQR_09585, partial [Marinirhabdus sp.]
IYVIGFILVVLFVVSKFADLEVRTHQLDSVIDKKQGISETQFLEKLRQKQDNTLFLIGSHGGGLKANVWTLNVLNKIQEQTKGKLLDQTIAMSGASGGSLGLALYTGLYRAHGKDTDSIQMRINKLAKGNYTALDLTLTFGLDTYRKLWPLSSEMVLRDRPYYAMVRYQNYIDREQGKTLSQLSFRDYWKEAYEKKSSRDTTGYFPSLIMNTAATNGSRGILWSVAQKDFTNIFPFSQNLADLPNDRTLPFYQAVSTTNRFPFLSPAAKIPGHGHYIDAGAIDNSGLLSLLDLHNHLRRCDTTILANKQVAYIEIVNGKSPYTEFVLTNFKKEMGNPHIFIDEFETDNIIADLKTGFNLDKIPNYLSNFLSLWQKTEKGKI